MTPCLGIGLRYPFSALFTGQDCTRQRPAATTRDQTDRSGLLFAETPQRTKEREGKPGGEGRTTIQSVRNHYIGRLRQVNEEASQPPHRKEKTGLNHEEGTKGTK